MKSITYAYYSSPHAEQYNKGESCWMVTLDTQPPSIFEDTSPGASKALKLFLSSDLPASPDSFTPEQVIAIKERY